MLVFLLFLCIFDKHLLWEAGPDSLFMCHILNRSWSYLLAPQHFVVCPCVSTVAQCPSTL